MINCKFCSKETENNKFCSRSCSTSFTNINNPRIKKGLYFCENCNKSILSHRNRFCEDCRKSYNGIDFTLKEAIYTNHHKSSAYALIRTRARALINKLKVKKQCSICNYSKHIEVAHIKSINFYSEDTLLSTINDPSNLTLLCPNCHWEFDHNMLNNQIKTVKDLIDNNILEDINQNKTKLQKKFYKEHKRTREESLCPHCKNIFIKNNCNQKYCSYNCSHTASRKTERPSKEQLEQEIKTTSFLQLGKKYGVSDNTIRKWVKAYELTI